MGWRSSCGLLGILAVAGTASADDGNYQSFLIGERAFGIGGAFAATADDASGAFYNPAGLALVPGSSISLSLSVYGLERRHVDAGHAALLDGEVVARDFHELDLTTLPTTVGLVQKFGRRGAAGAKRGAFGAAILLRDQSRFAVDGILAGESSRATYRLSTSDKTSWLGPFFAYQTSPRLALGAALFYSRRTVSKQRARGVESELPGCTTSDCLSTEVHIDDELVAYSAGELLARFGARYDFSPQLRVGLTVTTPSTHVRGSGRIASAETSVVLDPATGQGSAEFDPLANGGLATRDKHPLSVRVGIAYEQRHHFLIAADASFHAGVTFDPIALPDASDPTTARVDRVHVTTIERAPVVNGNIGGEYFVHRKWNVRAGFFTNFSSAPEVVVAPQTQLAHLDGYGVSAAVGYFSAANYELSLGVVYSFASGSAAAWDPVATTFMPASARHDAVFVYLTGARTWARRFAKKVAKKLRAD